MADLALTGEVIASVHPAGAANPDSGEQVLDLTGYVLLPAFAEPHAHLDKAYTTEDVGSLDGTLAGAITAWRSYRRQLGIDEIAARARAAALRALAHGVTAIRTHTDVAEGIGTRGWKRW